MCFDLSACANNGDFGSHSHTIGSVGLNRGMISVIGRCMGYIEGNFSSFNNNGQYLSPPWQLKREGCQLNINK